MTKQKKFYYTIVLLMMGVTLAACSGEVAESNNSVGEQSTPEEVTVTKPDPVTTVSGNSFKIDNESGSAEYQTGSGYTMVYTVLDYTTNVLASELPIDEFTGPSDEQQLVKVRIGANVTRLRMRNCMEPLVGFHLLFGDEDKQNILNVFQMNFKKGMALKCLAVDETQILEFYFKIRGRC